VLAGDGKIEGWKANLPGPALMRVLNILSKGKSFWRKCGLA